MTEKHRRGTSPAAFALETYTGNEPNPGADGEQKHAKKQSRASSSVRKYVSRRRRRRKESSSFSAGDNSASDESSMFGDFHGNDTKWLLLGLTMTILLLAFSGLQASYKHPSQEVKSHLSYSQSKLSTRRRTRAIHHTSSEHSTISSTKKTPSESTQKAVPKIPTFTKSYYKPRPIPISLSSTTNPNEAISSSSSSPRGTTRTAIESNTLTSKKETQHFDAPETADTATTQTRMAPSTRNSSVNKSPDSWKTLKSLHEPSSATDVEILWILNESNIGNYLRDTLRKCHSKSILDLSIGIGNNHADINVTPSLTIAATSQFITPHTGRIFSVLQDPVDTAMAIINHERKVRHKELPPSIKNINLDHLTDNPLTRHLANVGSSTHLTMEHYETAKTNMEKYVLVGTANRLEATIDRFERYFGWTFTNNPLLQERCRKISILTSSDSTLEESEAPSEELKTELRQRNNFDVLLYNYASTTLFDNQASLIKDVPINNRLSAAATTQRRLRRAA